MSQELFFRCTGCGGVNRIPAERLDRRPVCGRCGAALATSGGPQALDDGAVESLIRSSPVPVLVDFYADWCPPCRALAPILDVLARRHAGQLFVAKVDTGIHKRTAARLGVRGIPAIFLFRRGELLEQTSGSQPLAALEAMVRPHLRAG